MSEILGSDLNRLDRTIRGNLRAASPSSRLYTPRIARSDWMRLPLIFRSIVPIPAPKEMCFIPMMSAIFVDAPNAAKADSPQLDARLFDFLS